MNQLRMRVVRGHRRVAHGLYVGARHVRICKYITRYGSTLYIGIAKVFVVSSYIRKFFHFQV